MENVQAAVTTPSAAPAKAAATETPLDSDGAPLPGAFLAVLTQQVKSLMIGPETGAERTDANASDTDPAPGATASALAAEPAAIALPILAALPPALAPAAVPDETAAATVAVAVAPPPAAPILAAASPPAATAAPAPALIPASTPIAAPRPPGLNAQSAADGRTAADAARRKEAGAVSEPRATPAPEPGTGDSTAALAARGELLRAAERMPQRGDYGRENNAPAVPQLAFTQALNEARQAPAVIAAAQLQLGTPLAAAGWGAELGNRVVWMVGEKQQVAELRVNPPDLGPLGIKLTIDDHQTTAVFTSPHSSVRDAVESALPRLREVLAESGIMLGNASVTADSPRDGSAFAPPARKPAAAGTESAAAATGLMPNIGSTVRGHGLVDLFA